MRKICLVIVLLVGLLIPNTVLADADQYGTIVWEGVLSNYNHGETAAKIRITLTGVVGEQVSAGKVNVYEKIIKSDYFDKMIIPVVDGGSIKVEHLGVDTSTTFEQTEGSMGLTEIRVVETYSSNNMDYIDSFAGYIEPSEFFVNPDFKHYVGADVPLDYSDLSYSHVANDKYIALISIPVDAMETHIQVVDESRAQSMMQEIRDGHAVRLVGKSFEESTEEEVWEAKLPEVNKSALESKYGIKISVDDGFFTEQEALNMIKRVYDRFPEGLIKEITSYYAARGQETHIRFMLRETSLSGSFDDQGSRITLYYYPNYTSGFGDWVIAHEMGHYVHKYINDRYGYDKFKNEWTALNHGIAYKTGEWSEDKYRDYFIREYGWSSYSEDVATVFEWLASVNNDELREQYAEQSERPILKKIDLLNKVLLESTNSVTDLNAVWGTLYPQSPSDFAEDLIVKATEDGLIPDDPTFQGIYQSHITRKDFSLLAVHLIEQATGMTVDQYAVHKGTKQGDWYYYGSFSSSATIEYRVRSNYPFSDTFDSRIFDLSTLGVINGIGDRIFDPDGYLTREQAAVIMRNLAMALDQVTSSEPSSYADHHAISSWATHGVDYVTTNGIMFGTGHNNFSPQDRLSYEQSIIMLHRLFTSLQ